jgi:hypothetical protein
MERDPQQPLRDHVLYFLKGGGAHVDFEGAIADLPAKFRGAKPASIPHTPWRLLEHMRLAQWDILDFCINPNYRERTFPDDYWPKSDRPENEAAWNNAVEQFRQDLKKMQELVANPKTDLFTKIAWGDGQTYLREALLIADHNSYHLGELVTVRRALGAWK